MKVTESTIRQIEITEIKGIDPIRVILSDLGPGQGRINIECWGKSWASYWGGMGERTIGQFFCRCSDEYLAGSLDSNLPANIFDPEYLSDSLKRAVINERRKGWMTHEEARERFDEIEETNFPETVDGLWSISGDMVKFLGDEWWYRLPDKPNPDYQYLCRIIKTVQQGLQMLKGGEV